MHQRGKKPIVGTAALALNGPQLAGQSRHGIFLAPHQYVHLVTKVVIEITRCHTSASSDLPHTRTMETPQPELRCSGL
jgi:hypothetical protein